VKIIKKNFLSWVGFVFLTLIFVHIIQVEMLKKSFRKEMKTSQIDDKCLFFTVKELSNKMIKREKRPSWVYEKKDEIIFPWKSFENEKRVQGDIVIKNILDSKKIKIAIMTNPLVSKMNKDEQDKFEAMVQECKKEWGNVAWKKNDFFTETDLSIFHSLHWNNEIIHKIKQKIAFLDMVTTCKSKVGYLYTKGENYFLVCIYYRFNSVTLKQELHGDVIFRRKNYIIPDRSEFFVKEKMEEQVLLNYILSCFAGELLSW
jgi:hypothetical protein